MHSDKPKLEPFQMINLIGYLNEVDESGDATIYRFIEEDPAVVKCDVLTFCERYLIWSQGTEWWKSSYVIAWVKHHTDQTDPIMPMGKNGNSRTD
jgi:hypothetical protein